MKTSIAVLLLFPLWKQPPIVTKNIQNKIQQQTNQEFRTLEPREVEEFSLAMTTLASVSGIQYFAWNNSHTEFDTEIC